MEFIERADPFCRLYDLLLVWDGAPDFLEGDFAGMPLGKDLALLDCGLGVVRLIDGDKTERVVAGDSVMRDCSGRVVKDKTRERGVDGTTGVEFLVDESAAPKGLLERAVRVEPATDGGALRATESR